MVKRDTLVRCFDTGMAVPAATAPQQEESFFASGDHQPPICPEGGPRRDAATVSNTTGHRPRRAGDAELTPEHALHVDAEAAADARRGAQRLQVSVHGVEHERQHLLV
jgi:hypothetical protein